MDSCSGSIAEGEWVCNLVRRISIWRSQASALFLVSLRSCCPSCFFFAEFASSCASRKRAAAPQNTSCVRRAKTHFPMRFAALFLAMLGANHAHKKQLGHRIFLFITISSVKSFSLCSEGRRGQGRQEAPRTEPAPACFQRGSPFPIPHFFKQQGQVFFRMA